MARPGKQQEAARWLRSYLARGSRPQQDVKDAASGLGISPATLNRVKLSLGIESLRRGAGFHWRDPDIAEEQFGSQSLVDAIDRMSERLSRAIRQLANSQRSNGQQIVELDDAAPPSEADKFVWGFEEEDYEQATAETLLRYLAFQEKELGKIGTEPPSENREYRTKRLKDQIKQTTEWYNRKNTSTF